MTVASVRDVRKRRVDWWEPDQLGRPITPAQAWWLRKGMLHKLPGTVARSLARRGLLAGMYIGQPNTGLTELGERYRKALGTVPTKHLNSCSYLERGQRTQFAPSRDDVLCHECRHTVPAELIAWTGIHDQCINCKMGGKA